MRTGSDVIFSRMPSSCWTVFVHGGSYLWCISSFPIVGCLRGHRHRTSRVMILSRWRFSREELLGNKCQSTQTHKRISGCSSRINSIGIMKSHAICDWFWLRFVRREVLCLFVCVLKKQLFHPDLLCGIPRFFPGCFAAPFLGLFPT